MPVTKYAVLNEIPFLSTTTHAHSESTVIVTVLLPVDDEHDAAAVCESMRVEEDSRGGLAISFTTTGKSFSFFFDKHEEGLVLK